MKIADAIRAVGQKPQPLGYRLVAHLQATTGLEVAAYERRRDEAEAEDHRAAERAYGLEPPAFWA